MTRKFGLLYLLFIFLRTLHVQATIIISYFVKTWNSEGHYFVTLGGTYLIPVRLTAAVRNWMKGLLSYKSIFSLVCVPDTFSNLIYIREGRVFENVFPELKYE